MSYCMFAAVEAVRERLLRATAAVERHGVPYAVCEGNATAAWVATVDPGAVRNCPTVNLLIRRTDLTDLTVALTEAGFVAHAHPTRTLFTDGANGSPRSAVVVWFADEPSPDPSDGVLLPATAFPVLGLEPLTRMLLTVWRTVEKVLLRDLIDVGLIDATWPARFRPELAARLQQILDTPDG